LNRSPHILELPAQMIDLFLVLAEVYGEVVHFVHQQRNASLLNPSRRDLRRFTQLVLFALVAPIA